jgi:hypothetical protein
MSLNEVIKTRVGRSYVANYIFGETFQFQFPRHLRLFAELKAWESGGRSLHVNGIWNAVELPTQAHGAYGSYITRRGSSAAASTARGESTEGHGAAAAGDGSADDDDGTDAIEAATTEDDDGDIATAKWKARLGKAYFRIGSVQKQFLAESVDNLNAGRIRVSELQFGTIHPPDITRRRGFQEDGEYKAPIVVFSPTDMHPGDFQRRPCAFHG